jgi:hypothetical protein
MTRKATDYFLHIFPTTEKKEIREINWFLELANCNLLSSPPHQSPSNIIRNNLAMEKWFE